MSIREGLRSYYGLFGFHGLFCVAKARLLQKPIEAMVSVPGIKHPVSVRLRTSDVTVFNQVLVLAEYDCDFLKTPKVIDDAGANVGLTSVFYANKYPTARIFAIEPESSNFEMLKKNTAPYSNIVLVHAGLWKCNKELSLVDPGIGKYGFQTLDKLELDRTESRESVPGITVDRLMADHAIDHIDILKVDIEGAEREVFEDASSWID